MTFGRSIGIQLPEVERRVAWPEMLHMARLAEDVGFDSIWVGDHLLYDLPDGTPRGPWEVWTSLAALAAATSRVTIGPLVASLGFHDPAMLAKMAATVDAIAGGRLLLGIGAGWNEREYRAFGLPFDHRVSRFEEAFHVMRRLLAGETIDHQGRWFRYERCLIDPPAATPGGPALMVGSIAPRMLSITLPHVAMWNTWFSQYGNSSSELRAVVASVHQACVAAGRDPDTLQGSAAVHVRAPGGTGRAMGDPEHAAPPIAGDQSTVAAAIESYFVPGVHHLQLVVDPIDAASIEWLGGVLPLISR